HAEGPPPEPGRMEPTHAERARTLVELGGNSTLATISAKHPGYPFGSIMPYAADADGCPLFLISSMAVHTRNLNSDGRATLLITQHAAGSPLGAGRVSLIGDVSKLEGEDQMQAAQSLYLAKHPESSQWLQYGDFSFYRLDVIDVYFVGGFGVMGWVRAEDYRAAGPDPLCHVATSVIEHMNSDHADAVRLLGERSLGVKLRGAQMTSLDRLGFHLRAETEQGAKGTRVTFPEPVASSDEVRRVLVQMVQQARANATEEREDQA
ncbi:MAG: DUF2470 domain-containing protein, partial [Planctomycetales bacterium]|nr:DUF2470 domain-containing protein [Planctomycetales bacterium]